MVLLLDNDSERKKKVTDNEITRITRETTYKDEWSMEWNIYMYQEETKRPAILDSDRFILRVIVTLSLLLKTVSIHPLILFMKFKKRYDKWCT